MPSDCPGCASETSFCFEHQKHEKEVYESTRFKGKHDTQEFRMALHDAREQDISEN